ncbi:hypothetical protein [Roseibium sediminicola]|uniref:Uncharacterized protein n=1 Tax=Roseibium sediminicola TaxID=2933272 RepID=A0ABT0GZG7_9HYPH|nr:hypothetical protein [Roseibium sp. CAU 1639]MCK7614233.1 hypothetical protein [Roseibium sp. CAU 1639]
MRYFVRNLHVYVFALVSVLAAVWVANNPVETLRQLRPLVEDAAELNALAQGAYQEVSELSLKDTTDEAVSLFVATMRMPTLLFERLAEKLDAVEKDLNRRKSAKAVSEAQTLLVHKVVVTDVQSESSEGLTSRPQHLPRI